MESEFKAQTKFKAEFDESGNLVCYSRIETDRAYYVSLNLAAILTGRDRATVTRAVRELESFDGPKGAKLYRYRHLLFLVAQAIYRIFPTVVRISRQFLWLEEESTWDD